MVYWCEDGQARHRPFDGEPLATVLAFTEALRARQRAGEPVRFVAMVGEHPQSVGAPGGRRCAGGLSLDQAAADGPARTALKATPSRRGPAHRVRPTRSARPLYNEAPRGNGGHCRADHNDVRDPDAQTILLLRDAEAAADPRDPG